MRTFFVIIAFLGLFFIAGAPQAVAQKKKTKPGKDFMLMMERSPCRGNCPSYIVTIDSKGNVIYEGRRSVNYIGTYRKTISSAQLKQIVAAMNNANYFSFDEKYDNENIADAVTWTINYTNRGKTKQVTDRYGAPETLKELQIKLEDIIGDSGYTKAD